MPDPRTAMRGSKMTRMGRVCTMVLAKVKRCFERVKGNRSVAPVLGLVLLTRVRRWMCEGSPPAASTRGLMVSAAPSSGAIKRTLPWTPGVPSGMGRPVVIRAARSMVIKDLPRPGSPSRVVNLPRGMRFSQSQWSCSDLMSESKVLKSSERLSWECIGFPFWMCRTGDMRCWGKEVIRMICDGSYQSSEKEVRTFSYYKDTMRVQMLNAKLYRLGMKYL